MSLTHQQTCESVARWFLTQRWCDVAVCEIAGRTTRNPDRPPEDPGWPRTTEQHDAWRAAHNAWWDGDKLWRASPAYGGGFLDVLAVSARGKKTPRIAIAEIKVSLSDLRGDLRKGKMLRYEPQATHLYLAGPEKVIEQAPDLGLPAWWGLMVAGQWPWILRAPKKNPHAPDPTVMLRDWWTRQVARSLSNRVLRDAVERDRRVAEMQLPLEAAHVE